MNDYCYGPVKAIVKLKGKYYVFHKYGQILSATLNGKLPETSPVSMLAFKDRSNFSDQSKILDVQPVFAGNTVLLDTQTIDKYAKSDTRIDSRKGKISVTLNGNTAVYYTNSKVSYLNGKKVIQNVNAVFKDKRYFIEAFSAFKVLGFKLSYNSGKRLLSLEYDFTPTIKMCWKKLYGAPHTAYAAASNGKTQIELGNDTKGNCVIYCSQDGKGWQTALRAPGNSIINLCWCDSFYLAVGGVEKNKQELEEENNKDMQYSMSRYWGRIYKSIDGKQWEVIDTGKKFGYITSIASHGEMTIISDHTGNAYKTNAGLTFTKCLEISNNHFGTAEYVSGKYYLHTWYGLLYLSSDAVHWNYAKTGKCIIGSSRDVITSGEKGALISRDFGKSFKQLFRFNGEKLYLYSYCTGGGQNCWHLPNKAFLLPKVKATL